VLGVVLEGREKNIPAIMLESVRFPELSLVKKT
jgi:hypothetical protein